MSFLASHPILAVIFFIAFLVFVHETGHFLVGKWCGIGVEVYSIGFGPKLLGFVHRGTDYRLCLLPLGGYVKFAGANPMEDVPSRFHGQEMYRAPVWARALTILAGPLANLLLAVAIFTCHGLYGVEHPAPIIGMVQGASPAAKAGLLPGDRVLSVNAQELHSWHELRAFISSSAGKPLQLKVQRPGQAGPEVKSIDLVPERLSSPEVLPGEAAEQGRIGISFGFIPAILSPLGDKTATLVAVAAGLKAGEKVEAVSYRAGPKEEPEKTIQLGAWHEFLWALEQAYREGAQGITLNLSSPLATAGQGLEKGAGQGEDKRVLMLATTAWYKDPALPGLDPMARQIQLAKLLGITDSQLTISQIGESLKGEIKPGDRLVAFDGTELKDIFALSELLQANRKPELGLKVQRGQELLDFVVALNPVEVQKPEGKETLYQLDVQFYGQAEAPPPVVEKYSNPLMALSYGFKETALKSAAIVQAIAGLVTGQLPLKSLGGPMLIAKVAGDAAEAGWLAFFVTMALISINLGMLNLFPIPALDGGQLVLALVEGVRRKPLSESAMENFQRLGFVMVLALILLATYNDLSRFWSSMLKGVVHLFE